MDIKIKQLLDVDITKIIPLYSDAGWTNYTQKPEMLAKSFENSLAIFGAFDNEVLVGIIRVVGDGYSIIYIQDIIVLKSYQRKGIGSSLLKKVLNEYANVYQKVLLTENQPETINFYKSLGFVTVADLECVAFIQHS